MIKYKFSNKKDQEFAATLRKRVNAYFQENNIDKNANSKMVTKTVLLFAWYLVPYFLILFSGITNVWVLTALWITVGMGKAFVGTAVMHDSVHGSYSKDRFWSSFMKLSAAAVGVDALIWKIQHNVIHHTYTNIEDTDEDILPRYVFRFSEHQPRRWFHRFQHIYAPIFYCVPLIEWITTKDFIKVFEYRTLGFIKPGKEFAKELFGVFFRKAAYWALFLIPPFFIVDVAPMTMAMMIFVSHCVTGILLAFIFQTAHVVPFAEFIKAESEHIDKSWVAHQLFTTANYGRDKKLLTWLVGGLNFQIEHHLFPDICHIHYPQISGIVEETAKEFGLPYHYEKSFPAAVIAHLKLLKLMGQPEPKIAAAAA